MILETDRLILRPWTLNDVNDIVECLNNKEAASGLDHLPFPYTIEHAKTFINGIEQRKDNNYYDWAIVLKATGKVIGGTALNLGEEYNNIGYLTYIYINPNYQNQGYAAEAWDTKIDFAFSNVRIDKLESGFFEGNEASKKMQLKFGAKIINYEKETYYNPATDKKENQYTTQILKSEYLENNKNKGLNK